MSRFKFGSSIAPALALALFAAAGASCTRAQARVVAVPTPLEIPPPPPHQVEPVITADLPPAEPLDADRIVTTPPERPPRSAPARTEAERPADPPPANAATVPPRAEAATTLQTVPADREGQVQRSIRANLDGAIANLNRVEYQRLGADARVNFDQARRFIAQAEEALQARNLVFAQTVADKAATLAAQLAGR